MPADPPTPHVPTPPPEPHGGVRETVEQILVAFILAFIFRAYVVEAFVIPTGSMATTLLGAHLRHTCADCGDDFTVNYGAEGDGDELLIPRTAQMRARDSRGRLTSELVDRVYALHCSNCGFRVPRTLPADPANDATAPPVHHGDRILVLKYLYLLHEPRRWDVVVFKNPAGRGGGGGFVADYTQNYIKRLIGRPGETVMILDGDIYVATKPDPAPADFTIARKPDDVQQTLWRNVYDNDYQPRGLPRHAVVAPGSQIAVQDPAWQSPWRDVTPDEPTDSDTAPRWDTAGDGGRTFRFRPVAGTNAPNPVDDTATLAFDPDVNVQQTGIDPRPGGRSAFRFAWHFTDWSAYNVTLNQFQVGLPVWADTHLAGGYTRDVLLNTVTDAKLALDYRRLAGDGPLTLTLTQGDAVFTATLTPGTATLMTRLGDGEPRVVGGGPVDVRLPRGRPVRVEFANADYRVSLKIDGREVLATNDDEYAPDVAALLAAYDAGVAPPKPRVLIAAARHAADVSRVRVDRDVYYNNTDARREPVYWASPENFPDRLITLGPDEYFVLGDNALISGDARTWTQPVNLPAESLTVEAGRVPARFLLGRAFFVYWPAGFSPGGGLPALVPNVAQMRFIR